MLSSPEYDKTAAVASHERSIQPEENPFWRSPPSEVDFPSSDLHVHP